jgi:hypothetical protein
MSCDFASEHVLSYFGPLEPCYGVSSTSTSIFTASCKFQYFSEVLFALIAAFKFMPTFRLVAFASCVFEGTHPGLTCR